MSAHGKVLGAIVGAAAGLAFGSPMLALVLAFAGAIIGHALDARNAELLDERRIEEMPKSVDDLLGAPAPRSAPLPPPSSTPPPRLDALEASCKILVAIAALEGEVTQPQVHAMRLFFDGALAATAEERGHIRLWLKVAIDRRPSPDAVELAPLQHFAAEERLALVGALFDVVRAAEAPNEWADRAVRTVARRLSVNDHAVRELLDLRAGDLAAHFATLGVAPGISDEELKRAYRKLAREHHPDTVAHLGPAAVERASERFRQIDLAYETLRRARGL